MDRVKFCPDCDEVLPWDATTCKECGAPVPEDPQAFEKARAAKEKELEKLRAAAARAPSRPERPPSAPILRTSAGYVSPTGKAIRVAVWGFVLGVIALMVSTVVKLPLPLGPLLHLAGLLLLAIANLAVFWVIIHSAVVSAIRVTRQE
jgi:hypothetical protein